MVPIPGGRLLRIWIQKVVPTVTNVSIPEVNMLENSSILTVSLPISLYTELGFVNVNGPKETYFEDSLLFVTQENSRGGICP